ncbi:hypothetical protein L208DRAFT_1403025 [Tricholoma matsutake]|nr:hypothetical protein L208DRAFT_1403025 [Tricholoma matsutake 945]
MRLGLSLTLQVLFFLLFEKLSAQYEVGSLSYVHHDIASPSSWGMALNNLLC